MFAGFHVCRAMSRVAIVTATDCNKCVVPETLKRVDCFLLSARVTLAPEPQVRWSCAATAEIVRPDGTDDCQACLVEGPPPNSDGDRAPS